MCPTEAYEADQTLVFPALDFAVGTVTDVRPGINPEHGDFEVITVQFEGDAEIRREFAASLQTPHRLESSGWRLPAR